MRVRHIEIFQAILQAGTLTGAAKLLHVSQPAASKLLQYAERQLGFPLFTRVHGRLQLTHQGRLLSERIEKISDELRDLQRLTDNIRQPETQSLRVVCTPTLARALLPDAVVRLKKSVPNANIELYTQHTREMVNSILLHETDLGLTLQSTYHPSIEQKVVREGQVMAIAPSDWWNKSELARPLRLSSLAGKPMIGIATRDGLGRSLRAHIQYLDPPPDVSIWVQTYQLARSLVAHGMGLALVDPFTALDRDDDQIQVRHVEPSLQIALSVLYRKGSKLTSLQKQFLEQVDTICSPIMVS